MFERWFLAHPRSVGEGYFVHQRAALGFACLLFAACLACLIHALVPGLFERTASGIVGRLNERMLAKRRARVAEAHPSAALEPRAELRGA